MSAAVHSRNIAVLITANASGLRQTMYSAAYETEAFGRKINRMGHEGSRAMTMLGTAAKVGMLAMVVALGLAVTQAVKFEATMNNVGTNTSASQKQIDSLGQSVLNLSKRLPQDAQDLAEGLYFVTSSAFEGAGALTVLENSARAATAGLASTEDSSQAVVSVLNAYGLTAKDSAWAADVLFQSVKLGVMRFSDLTTVVGHYIATAAALKVPFEDVQAALATMTLQGLSAAESSTSLNGVMRTMLKPSDALSAAMDRAGVSVSDLSDPAIGLHGVMVKLQEVTGGNAQAMRKLFPEIRAYRGAMLLINHEGRTYNRVFEGMKESTGAVEDALKIQMKGLGNQLKVGVNKLKAFGIEVGLAIIPVLSSIFESLEAGTASLYRILATIAKALAPTGRALADIGRDGVDAFKSIFKQVVPVATVLGGAMIVGLNGLTTGFSSLFHVFAQNQAVLKVVTTSVMALLAVRAVSALPTMLLAIASAFLKLTAAIGANGVAVGVRAAVDGLATMGSGLGMVLRNMFAVPDAAARMTPAVTTGFSQMGAGARQFAGALATPQVAIALLAAGLITYIQGVSKAHAQAKQTLAELTEGVDNNSLTSLSKYRDVLWDARDATRKAADGTAGWAKGLKYLGQMASPAKNSIMDIRVAAEDTAKAAEEMQGKYAKMLSFYNSVRRRSTSVPDQASFDAWVRKLTDLGFDVPTLTAKQFAAAVDDVSAGAINGSSAIDDYKAAVTAMADETATATDKVDALKAAFDALIGGPLAIFNANTKYKQGLADLTAAIAENGTTLDINTEKGRKNRDMVAGQIQNALDMANAIAKVNGDDAGLASLKTAAEKIFDIGTAAGLSKDEMTRLWQEFHIDPDSLKLDFSVDGVTEAENLIDGFKAKVKDKSVKMILDTKEAKNATTLLLADMELFSKTHPVTAARLDINQVMDAGNSVEEWFAWYSAANPSTAAILNTLDPEVKSAILSALAQKWRDEHPSTNATVTGVDAVDAALNRAARERIAVIRAIVQGQAGIHQSPQNRGASGDRWGGIHSYRHGGIDGAVAMGPGKSLYRWREPGTGGEALIPKNGDPQRSKGVLETAASWYGMQVFDPRDMFMAHQGGGAFGASNGGAAGGSSLSVEVNFNAPVYGIDDLNGEVRRAVLGAISDQWDDVVTVIKRKEMARR